MKRYAQSFLREQGLTREQLEQRIGAIVRPRPRWVPRWLWNRLLQVVVNPSEFELVRMHQP